MGEPIERNERLTRGEDFARYYERGANDTPFPAGTTARIEISKDAKVDSPLIATWEATEVTDDWLHFWVQSTEAETIPHNYRYRLMVRYPAVEPDTETLDLCWYRGKIVRKD